MSSQLVISLNAPASHSNLHSFLKTVVSDGKKYIKEASMRYNFDFKKDCPFSEEHPVPKSESHLPCPAKDKMPSNVDHEVSIKTDVAFKWTNVERSAPYMPTRASTPPPRIAKKLKRSVGIKKNTCRKYVNKRGKRVLRLIAW